VTVAVHMSKLIATSVTPIGPAPQLLSALEGYADEGLAPPVIRNVWLSPGASAAAPAVLPPDQGPPYAVSVPTGRSFLAGATVAAFAHALLIAAALVHYGTAGAPQQTSENAIEVEIVLDAPGTPGGPASSADTAPAQTHQVEPSSESGAEIIANEATPTPTTAREETRSEPEPAATFVTQPSEQPPTGEPPPDTVLPVEAEAVPGIPTPSPPPPSPPPATKPKSQTRVANDAPSKPQPMQAPAIKRTASIQAAGDGGAHGRQAAAGQNALTIDAFKAAVAARIARNKPSTDIAALAQGVVTVTFGIGSGGEAQSLRVARSSGHAVLDEAALQTVRKASPFPPPPPGAPRTFNVPIRFNVR